MKVQIRDPFWNAWRRELMGRGLEHQWNQIVVTGRLDNFDRAARGEGQHQGFAYNDSDVYKWLEAASYALSLDPGWYGREWVDEAVRRVASAQTSDGYLHTFTQLRHPEHRWKALASKHEMYCLGQLIEAGCAHRALGADGTLLAVATRAADLVCSTFGPGLRKGYCGHQEIELALARLSTVTGVPSYRQTGKWMTDERGTRPSPFEAEFADSVGRELNQGYVPLVWPEGRYDGTYFQDDRPLAAQIEAVGHAVRAMYGFCGALDCGSDVLGALEGIWTNLVRKRIYITGGIGSAGANEGFTRDFDLPNREAYAETCAAIGLVFWAARMSRATRSSIYADWLERALYNAVLSGINFDTDRYFYDNPLESRGDRERQPWFDCACCPPNVARLILSVERYCAHFDGNVLTIDVPVSATYSLPDGVEVTVESDYPWGEDVEVSVHGSGGVGLRVRVPSWARDFEVGNGGRPGDDGYLGSPLRLQAGDRLSLSFRQKPEWQVADVAVADAAGRVALCQGPLVYCLEQADLGASVHQFVPDLEKPVQSVGRGDARLRQNLRVEGDLSVPDHRPDLYRPHGTVASQRVQVAMVPYYSWANRGAGSMAVWLRQK